MFGIIKVPIATIYESPAFTIETDEGVVTNIADEIIYGTTCRIIEKTDDWCQIMTFYGYVGYVESKNILFKSEEEIKNYLKEKMQLTVALNADILTKPHVRGVIITSLPSGALLRTKQEKDGWTKVELLDGQTGYLPTIFLDEKRFTEDFLLMPLEESLNIFKSRTKADEGGKKDFSLTKLLDKYYSGQESLFRYELASFAIDEFDVQYRWGGRSSWGTDCSGLIFQAYLRAGILVFRDASIANGYSIKRICSRKESDPYFDMDYLNKIGIREGDALYFPGHIGMYLGEGKYIHSAGKAGSNGVVINSFYPDDDDYREDLQKNIYAVGGVR